MRAGSAEDDVAPDEETPSRGSDILRDHRATLVLVSILTVYVIGRIIALSGFTVFTSYDTGSYAPRPGILEPFNTVSFTGDAPRPWGVPLLYALVGTDEARVVLQWVVGTLGWALLTVAVWLNIRSLVARTVAAGAIVGLALSSSVYPWDLAILSEALSIGLGIMAFAFFAIWAKTRSWVAAGALSIVAVWWTFTRPDVLPYIVLLLAVMVVYAWLRRDRRRSAALVAAVILVGLCWEAATVSRTDEAFRSWGMNLGLSESTFVYRLRLEVFPDPVAKRTYVEQFGMPGCPAADVVARRKAWSMADFIAAYRSCPELVAWTAQQKETLPLRYIAADPVHYAKTTLGRLSEMLGGTVGAYAKPVRGIPRFTDKVFFPSRAWVLPVALTIFLLALTANIWTGAFRSRTWLAVTGIGLVAASCASALAGLLYSAGEYGRFGIQEAVFLRVGLIIMIAAAIDAFNLGAAAAPSEAEAASQPLALEGTSLS